MGTLRASRYAFARTTGYILPPGQCAGGLVALGHTASVLPWIDPDVHTHETAEEYFLVRQGRLRFWVAGISLSLCADELLMVRPRIPHCIVGGDGPIEHFGLRAPAPADRQSVGRIPRDLPELSSEGRRELCQGWGYRVPLGDIRNQNCWLIGLGQARFPSRHLLLAYLDFPTHEAANAEQGTRHRLHLHEQSWEHYVVLEGSKTLLVDGQLVKLEPGELLQVPPGVPHTVYRRQAPYKGFTFRVPVLDDKIECAGVGGDSA
jgi:mannose-6-phosphate isomerase-like protein (cupin superfamily)